METDNSELLSKIIHNPELLSRTDVGLLVLCSTVHSADSLQQYLSDSLLKQDFTLRRYRIDDRIQDPGTIIEVLTNFKDIIILIGDIIEGLNIIIDQALLLSTKIAGAAVALDQILKKDSILKKTVKSILAILKWAKKTDDVVTLEANKKSLKIVPQKIDRINSIPCFSPVYLRFLFL